MYLGALSLTVSLPLVASPQGVQQLLVDATESPIAHDQDLITWCGLSGDPLDDGVHPRKNRRPLAQFRKDRGRVPAQVDRGMDIDPVGVRNRGRQFSVVHPEAHRIGAWFQDGKDAGRADLAPQPLESGGDGCWVMGEIVVDPNTLDLTTQFHAALHPLEAAQRRDADVDRYTGVAGGGEYGQGVVDVVQAGLTPVDPPLGGTIQPDLEVGAVGFDEFGTPTWRGGWVLVTSGPAHGAGPNPKDLARGPAAHGQDLIQGRVGGGVDDEPAPRDGAYQVVKLALDLLEIVEDVRVVEFQVVEDDRTWPVVDELGAFVEEGGVVLVRLHHEEGGGTQASRNAEVQRHPADQESRVEPRVCEHPGEHARGGGLAMGAGHAQYPTPPQQVGLEPFGAGTVGQTLIQHVFDCRDAAAHSVADDHHVRCRVQVRGVVTLHQGDPRGLELGTHRRIDVGIGTGHAMAQGAGELGDAAHEGAADSKYVQVHVGLLSRVIQGGGRGVAGADLRALP